MQGVADSATLLVYLGQIWNFKLDLAKRKCSTDGAADRASVEFPTAHPYRHGRKGSRYSYLMASDRNNRNLPYRDVVKVCVCLCVMCVCLCVCVRVYVHVYIYAYVCVL